MNYENAAIIGYWRCGAKPTEIAILTGVKIWLVEIIIHEYQIKYSSFKTT